MSGFFAAMPPPKPPLSSAKRGGSGSRMLLERMSILHLILLMILTCNGQLISDWGEEVTSPSGQEYLGQFTFFRSWITKRRVFMVRASDEETDKILREAVYKYRCQLAIRHVNLVLLGDRRSTETVFYHSEDNRRDFYRTRTISPKLRRSIGRHIRNLYRDLNRFRQWALYLGYDGGRKRMYRKVNFPALFDKIDHSAIRRREAKLQWRKSIKCPEVDDEDNQV